MIQGENNFGSMTCSSKVLGQNVTNQQEHKHNRHGRDNKTLHENM